MDQKREGGTTSHRDWYELTHSPSQANIGIVIQAEQKQFGKETWPISYI